MTQLHYMGQRQTNRRYQSRREEVETLVLRGQLSSGQFVGVRGSGSQVVLWRMFGHALSLLLTLSLSSSQNSDVMTSIYKSLQTSTKYKSFTYLFLVTTKIINKIFSPSHHSNNTINPQIIKIQKLSYLWSSLRKFGFEGFYLLVSRKVIKKINFYCTNKRR